MLKVIDWLLFPRETRELGRLNEIHEAFNEKQASPEQTRHAIYNERWKYHHEKVDLLMQFTFLIPTNTQP